MDVIEAYLNTMFAPYAQTPRLNSAKAELREMMEDAYTAALAEGASDNEAVGRVITEFGNLDEVAPALGITADLSGAAPGRLPITVVEAQSYSDFIFATRWQLAIAVALFVVSPGTLILLAGSSADNPASVIVGLVVLLILAATGVAILIQRSGKLAQFDRVTRGDFEPTSEVSAWAASQSRQAEPKRATALAVAVVVWILAALPVIITGLLADRTNEEGLLVGGGVCGTLILVATGLLIFLPTNWARSVESVLNGEEIEEEETSSPIGNAILSAYWPLATAIYLAWSFVTNDWHVTWIVWPVAGVLFAAVAAFVSTAWPAKKSHDASSS